MYAKVKYTEFSILCMLEKESMMQNFSTKEQTAIL